MHHWLTYVALGILLLTTGCAGQASLSDTAPKVHVSIEAAAAWPAGAVQSQLKSATRRYAQCGIRLETHLLKATKPDLPIIRFVASLPPFAGKAVEGRAFDLDGQSIVEIAWMDASGNALDHKQTLAHELGHVLGLRHTPLHSINLMSPHGCELCSFTPGQCDTLRRNMQRL